MNRTPSIYGSRLALIAILAILMACDIAEDLAENLAESLPLFWASPVIILGMPRSGATALAYPFIRRNGGFTNESNLFWAQVSVFEQLMIVYPCLREQTPLTERIRAACEDLKSRPQGEQVYAVYNILAELRAQGIDLSRDVYLQGATVDKPPEYAPNQHDNQVWGDSCPVMIIDPRFPEYLANWPTAKLIYIQRDGRDVLASHIRLGWNTGGLKKLRSAWLRAYYAAEAVTKNILRVRQEALLTRPDAVIEEINKFLGFNALLSGDYNFFMRKPRLDGKLEMAIDYRAYFKWGDIPGPAQVVLDKLGYSRREG